MLALKSNSPSPSAAENTLPPPFATSNSPGTPGQPAVIQQRLPGQLPVTSSATTNPTLMPEQATYAPTPQQAYAPTPQQVVATEPEKVIVEKKVVYVRPRNRLHIGRTLYETAHDVLNLPNRLWGP
jgi:hypothetical protein